MSDTHDLPLREGHRGDALRGLDWLVISGPITEGFALRFAGLCFLGPPVGDGDGPACYRRRPEIARRTLRRTAEPEPSRRRPASLALARCRGEFGRLALLQLDLHPLGVRDGRRPTRLQPTFGEHDRVGHSRELPMRAARTPRCYPPAAHLPGSVHFRLLALGRLQVEPPGRGLPDRFRQMSDWPPSMVASRRVSRRPSLQRQVTGYGRMRS
jgi:hypothetical protein